MWGKRFISAFLTGVIAVTTVFSNETIAFASSYDSAEEYILDSFDEELPDFVEDTEASDIEEELSEEPFSGDDQIELIDEESILEETDAGTEDDAEFLGTSGDYEYSLVSGGVEITKFNGKGPSVTIPQSINGRNVVSIGESAFRDNTTITSVEIPDTVLKIGDFAFEDCKYLSKVKLPSSLTTVGYYAFAYCSGITSITLPDTIKNLGHCTFTNCTRLTKINIPRCTKELGTYLFANCTSLPTVTIPNWVTTIGGSAFENSGIRSITIPESVTSISNGVFSGCDKLTSIKVASGNTKYDSRNDCNAIIESKGASLIAGCKNTIIPDNVKSISFSAFNNCTGLTTIVIPGSVSSIGMEAFSGCSNLQSVSIPASVTTIGDMAFDQCTSLKSIKIPGKVTLLGNRTFMRCYSLTSVSLPASLVTIEDDVFQGCSELTSITIPGSVETIGRSAFGLCTSLYEVRLPKSLKSIDENAFDGCFSLQDVYYDGTKREFQAISIQGYNDDLLNANIHYSDEAPVEPDRNRVEIYSVTPQNGTRTAEHVDYGGWVNVNVSFSTHVPVKSVNKSKGALRIVEYDTNKVVYSSDSFTSFTVKKTSYGSVISLYATTTGIKDNAKYYIEIDEGLLSFENEYSYACVNKDEWVFTFGGRVWYLEENGQARDELLPYVFDVDNSYFLKSSYEYNYDLALIAYGITLSAFEAHNNSNYTKGYLNVQKTFKSFGFENFAYNDWYTKRPTPYSIGVSAATKTVSDGNKKYTVIAVPIRGAGYEGEWAGNATVDKGMYHAGFKSAADQVVNFLREYIKNKNITGDIKVVVTGYSRAAGTANVVASLLDDGALSDISQANLTRENIYGFCFEPPAVTTKSDARSSKYHNIVSYINYQDFVPKLPSYVWDFKRFGKEYYFNDGTNTQSSQRLFSSFLENYRSISNTSYDPSQFVPVGGSYPNDKEYWLSCFMIQLSTCIDRNKYCNSVQGDLQDLLSGGLTYLAPDAMAYYNIKSNEVDAVKFMKAAFQIACHKLASSVVSFTKLYASKGHIIGVKTGLENLVATFTNNGTIIAQEHYPLVNFAWVLTCKDKNFYYDGSYKYMIINCPVDVRVFDSATGQLVGEIIDDEAVDIEGSPVLAFVDANGQKVFILPHDESYDVKISATDSGKVNCCLLEGNASDGYTKRIDYLDIDVEAGDEISGAVEDGAYTLIKDGEDCTAEAQTDIVWNEVVLDAEEYGTVIGSGSYMKNEFVIAHAIPDTGAEFDGWYDNDGILISNEAEYRFRVDGDTEYTARFKEKDGLTAVVDEDLTYTGKALKPEVKVYDGVKELTAGKDYTVSYKNNKNAYTLSEEDEGFDPSKAPSITVIGKGNYKGKDTAYFVINPKYINNVDTIVQTIPDQKEDGKVKKPVPLIKLGKSKLKAGTDYAVTYLSEDGKETECKEAGTYIARVTGKGNYEGSIDCRFVIYSNQLIHISKAKVQKIPDYVYTSEPRDLSADVKLSYNKKNLEEGTDYKIIYNDDHSTVGSKSITIAGIGSFTGERIVTYNITGRAITKAVISGIESTYEYTGEERVIPLVIKYTQESKSGKTVEELVENEDYVVEYEDNVLPGTAKVSITGIGLYTGTVVRTFKILGGSIKNAVITNFSPTAEYSGQEIEQEAELVLNGKKLTLGTSADDPNADYIVLYSNNLNVGTATVTYKGINGYIGTVQKKFKINKKALNEDDFEILVSNECQYMKGGSTPEIGIRYNGIDLDPVKDYKVSYKNNKAVTNSTTKNKPAILVSGKGNFSGSISTEFNIIPSDISSEGITMYAKDVVATGRPGAWKSVPVVTDFDGTVLKAGADYESEILYYEVKDGDERLLSVKDNVEAGTVIKAIVTGKGSYSGTCETSYRVVKKDISKAKVNTIVKTYTGKEVTISPEDITLVLNNEKLSKDDYVIDTATYKNNILKGKATVVIRGVGDYGNSKTITFTLGAKGIMWWFRNILH